MREFHGPSPEHGELAVGELAEHEEWPAFFRKGLASLERDYRELAHVVHPDVARLALGRHPLRTVHAMEEDVVRPQRPRSSHLDEAPVLPPREPSQEAERSSAPSRPPHVVGAERCGGISARRGAAEGGGLDAGTKLMERNDKAVVTTLEPQRQQIRPNNI